MLKNIIKDRLWFFIGVLLCTIVCVIPTPEGLTTSGQYALGLLLMCIVFFLTEAIPLVAIAFLIVIFQVLSGIKTHDEVPRTFMHDAVFFIMGSLMIASVLVKYNLHKKIARLILVRFGKNINVLVYGIVGTCAISASFISEHTVASIMLPIGVGIVAIFGGIKKCPKLGKLLMLAIAYGSMIGAIGTPSGGVRNVIMMAYLKEFSNVTIGYGEWIIYSMPLTFIMIPIVSFVLLKVFKPEVHELPDANFLKSSDKKEVFSKKEIIVIAIFILTLIFWIVGGSKFGLGIIAIFSASIFLITKLAKWEDYAKNVNWQVILLYAGVISLGECLRDTGLANYIANNFIYLVHDFLHIKSNLLMVVFTVILTIGLANTMGPGPTIAVLGPIILQIGQITNINPTEIGIASAIASTFAYIMIVGAPASMIVYGSGFLKPVDFLKAGWIMSIVSVLILTLVIICVYWRFILGI